MLDVCLYHAFA
ncbi:hypothetical protein FG135_18530 [Vibrio cholerae]|nr:hypothetical protein [Vibrio cholerae]EJL6514317.1 hypothetical protein [Vibrio cholerae]EJL6630051.1 hypothetical protein [Vibrio cholerae]EJL6742578.1 hypothetical protein [Vibrio cholerae]EJL6880646.1 hypothetical protein [Vibrio cholerae]